MYTRSRSVVVSIQNESGSSSLGTASNLSMPLLSVWVPYWWSIFKHISASFEFFMIQTRKLANVLNCPVKLAFFLTVYVLRLISCFGAAQAVKQSSSFPKFICAPFGKKIGGGSQWRPNRMPRTKSYFVLNLLVLMMSGKTKHGNLKSQWIFRSASIF